MAGNENFDQWLDFDDRAPEDHTPGPARRVEIGGRCTECWGPVAGKKEGGGRWTRIECKLCDRSVNEDDAEREAKSMQREAENNLQQARVGQATKYREGASFVLKLLPDRDRDKKQVDGRIAASLAAGPRKGPWLSRKEIEQGTAGYLYLQARAFLSGVENLTHEMSAIALSDFDFAEPRIVRADASSGDPSVRVSAAIPALHRKPSDRELMARMGTALVAGMAVAFACEVGMKAILMTRLDEAAKTHDLLELYQALPADSRARLEADFAGIADVLEHNRHTFGKWRYFEQSVGEKGLRALVDTDRVWGLGKAARVIVDECVVVGLTYEVDLDSTFDVAATRADVSSSQRIKLTLDAGEAAIPWDDVLAYGLENP